SIGGPPSPPPSRSHATRRANELAGTTVMSGTRRASAAFAAGTITVRAPASAAASTAGRTPRTGRSGPPSPTPPRKNGSAIRSAGTSRAAPAIATAIARSKWPPFFGRPAGNRLTVIRASGQANPLLMTAERTRPRASLSAVSSRPIRWMPGTPRPTSASTSTTRPLIPTSATQRVRATGMSAHPPLVAEDELPGEPLQRHHVDPHPREPLGAAGQPPGREAVQPGHLLRGDGLQRRAVPVPGTGLHLDRDEGVAVPREDVDLALPASP